jgi:hypothetical protein
MSHIDITSPTYVHHLGYEPLPSSSHAKRMSLSIVNEVRVIHMIDNPRHVRRKPRFLCRTCEGYHLTHLCPATSGITEAWFSPGGPSGSEEFVVSPHFVSPFIDTKFIMMQSSPEHIPIF